METPSFIDAGRMEPRQMAVIESMPTVPLLMRFRRYIETSDWDERFIQKKPLFDRICLVATTLSGIILLGFLLPLP